jgi:protein-S-isoprenylcysteine O-methyltransferase Ste14
MNIKIILLIVLSYLYLFFEIMMSRRHRRDRSIKKSDDKGSMWVIVISIFVGFTLAFRIGASTLGRIYHWDAFFAAGILLVMLGLYIRISSMQALRQHFTYTVTNIENHELIMTGWYKMIRHPGYLGQLILLLGFATALSNWLSVIGMMLPVTIGFLYRINVEEKFMQQQMGQKYLDYKKITKRLIPGIF